MLFLCVKGKLNSRMFLLQNGKQFGLWYQFQTGVSKDPRDDGQIEILM